MRPPLLSTSASMFYTDAAHSSLKHFVVWKLGGTLVKAEGLIEGHASGRILWPRYLERKLLKRAHRA